MLQRRNRHYNNAYHWIDSMYRKVLFEKPLGRRGGPQQASHPKALNLGYMYTGMFSNPTTIPDGHMNIWTYRHTYTPRISMPPRAPPWMTPKWFRGSKAPVCPRGANSFNDLIYVKSLCYIKIIYITLHYANIGDSTLCSIHYVIYIKLCLSPHNLCCNCYINLLMKCYINLKYIMWHYVNFNFCYVNVILFLMLLH